MVASIRRVFPSSEQHLLHLYPTPIVFLTQFTSRRLRPYLAISRMTQNSAFQHVMGPVPPDHDATANPGAR